MQWLLLIPQLTGIRPIKVAMRNIKRPIIPVKRITRKDRKNIAAFISF